MNKIRYTYLKIVVFVLFTFHLSLFGFSQSNDLKDSPKKEIKPLVLVQIPDFGKSSMNLINDIQLIVDNQEKLNDILPELGDVLAVLNKKDSSLSDTLNIYRLDDLDKEERELSLLNQRIEQWKTTVADYKKMGQKKDSVASYMSSIWQVTLDSIKLSEKHLGAAKSKTEKSDDIKTGIIASLSDLKVAQEELQSYLESVQNMQTDITIAENKFGNILNLIDSRRARLKQSIWLPDYPLIWKVKKDTIEVNKSQRIQNFINADSNIIKAFLKNNPILPYYFGIFILLVVGTLLYLKPHAETLYANFQDDFKEATILLRFPLLTTLIIAWFCSAMFLSFPRELKDFIAILMFLPIVIILKKLNPKWKWFAILWFSLAYLLFPIIKELDYSHLGQRIFLICFNLITLILYILYKTKRIQIGQSENWLIGTYGFIINVLIGIGFISLIASILGSIQLAALLAYASLGVTIVLYVLRTAILLVRSLIFLILMGPLIKYSYILKEDGRLVLKKMDRMLKLVGVGFLIYFILEILNIREEFIGAFLAIINYPLEVGEMSISIGSILAFFITIQIAIWISAFIRYILEKEVFPRSHMTQGVPNTILLMIKFTITLLGILLAFAAAGIQMDKIAIAMGALGVGIGFGLQNIISNFISGIILALERPITIGDLIEIPNVSGVVRDIGIRASTVRTWDGSDVIVPNAELISNKLTNWTFYDRLRRVKTEIRVPFDTDIEVVSQLLLKIAGDIPEVMKVPKPYMNFKGIGTSAMEITLYCWINDADKIFSFGTAIRNAVFKGLQEAGYETPVPRQELKIDTEIEKLDNKDHE